jgi:hypothetical protein
MRCNGFRSSDGHSLGMGIHYTIVTWKFWTLPLWVSVGFWKFLNFEFRSHAVQRVRSTNGTALAWVYNCNVEILNATAYFLTPQCCSSPFPQPGWPIWPASIYYLPDNPHLHLSTLSDFMLGRLFVAVIQYIQIYIIFRICQRVGAPKIQKVPQIAKPQIF